MFKPLVRYFITIHFPESMPYWGVPGGDKVNGSIPHVSKNQSGGCGLMRLPRTCTLSFAVSRSVHRRPSYLLMVGKPSYINGRGSNFGKVRTRTELFGVVRGRVASVNSRYNPAEHLQPFAEGHRSWRTYLGGKFWNQYLRESRKDRMAGLA